MEKLTLAVALVLILGLSRIGLDGGGVLFYDDFSRPSSGWTVYGRGESWVVDYEEGGYRMRFDGPNMFLLVTAGLEFDDVRLEVEATKQGGSDGNEFGIACRVGPDSDQYYLFSLLGNGHFGVGKVVGTEIMIAEVVPGGQAAAAGLEAGEVILSVDGVELGNGVALGDALAGRVPGDTVSLWVRGLDGERPVDVTLAEHPEKEDAAFLGVQSIISPRMVGLGMSQPQHSIAMRAGEATNHLRADCAHVNVKDCSRCASRFREQPREALDQSARFDVYCRHVQLDLSGDREAGVDSGLCGGDHYDLLLRFALAKGVTRDDVPDDRLLGRIGELSLQFPLHRLRHFGWGYLGDLDVMDEGGVGGEGQNATSGLEFVGLEYRPNALSEQFRPPVER